MLGTAANSHAALASYPELAPNVSGLLLKRLPVAILITVMFALIALRMRSVTRGGAIAGAVVSVIIFTFAGAGGFVGLAAVFVLTAVATRIGRARKQKLGTAENRGGRRASQVLANLAVAAAISIPAALLDNGSWLLAVMLAALVEAAADTVSSECGQAWSDHVYLVTSFERVPVGTDGGISFPGTLAGMVAASVVALLCYWSRLVPQHWAVMAATAGVLGTFVDSLLGAAFERRRWLNNNLVNLLSTAAAAVLAALFLL
jgi:uncharacterized protein (TIGR00297 family)